MKSRGSMQNFRQSSLRPVGSRHTLLLAMAADLERLHAQAERIKELRLDKQHRDGKRISQETAAHKVGVSVRQYRTWESTGAVIQFDNLQALATYFDTSTSYIEFGEETRAETPDLSNGASQLDRIEERLDQVHKMLTQLLASEIVAGLQEPSQAESSDATTRDRQAA